MYVFTNLDSGSHSSPSSSHPAPVAGRGRWSALSGPVSKHFRIGESLGPGRFGEVLIVWDKRSDSMNCVRVMRPHKNMKRIEFTKQIDDNMAEINKYLKLRHENLIRYKSLILTGSPDIRGLGLVMSLGLASVRSLLPLSSSECRFVLSGMASGLAFLHARGLVHGHVCPESVFLDDYGVVKMSDYGMFLFKSRAGKTSPWSPPESKSLVETYSFSDIWCLGITACHFILVLLPYKNYKLSSPFTKLPLEIRDNLLGRVIASCLNLEPGMRVKAEVVRTSLAVESGAGAGHTLLTRLAIRHQAPSEARDSLGCDKCGEDTGYSPVMLSQNGSEFLCDNCLEEASGHQDCQRQQADCTECSDLRKTLLQRWRRQRSLEEFLKSHKVCETRAETDATNNATAGQILGANETKNGEQFSQEAVTIPTAVETKIIQELNNYRIGTQYGLRPKRVMEDCGVCHKKATFESGFVQKESGSFICEKCIAEANIIY